MLVVGVECYQCALMGLLSKEADACLIVVGKRSGRVTGWSVVEAVAQGDEFNVDLDDLRGSAACASGDVNN